MIYAMKILVKLYIERNGTLCHVFVIYIYFIKKICRIRIGIFWNVFIGLNSNLF